MLQSLKDICSAIEDNSIENNELMDGSYRVNDSIVEFIDWHPQLTYYYNPMKHKFNSSWSFEAEPNEDREGMQVFVCHSSGDSASLSCADNEGETCDGLRVPRSVVDACYRWIDQNKINY